MSTITKELIENILQFNSEGSDCPANAEQWEVHELARIALASLEAEPVAYMTYKGYLLHAADPKLAEYSEPTPLYDTPPAPVVPPENTTDRSPYYRAGWNACRAAMLQGAEPVSQPYTLRDGWVAVPVEMTPEQMRAVQLNSELGAYATANLSGAYSLFREFWDVAVKSAPNQEAK